jgi:hypothetical protein
VLDGLSTSVQNSFLAHRDAYAPELRSRGHHGVRLHHSRDPDAPAGRRDDPHHALGFRVMNGSALAIAFVEIEVKQPAALAGLTLP